MAFTLWLGAPLPRFVQEACASYLDQGIALSLYLDPLETHDADALSQLRMRGLLVEDVRSAPLDAAVERRVASFRHEKYGHWPLYSDAFRYTLFSRGSTSIWCDADSFCLRPLHVLPPTFVASEHARLAYPFRTIGLLDDHSFYNETDKNISTWFRTAKQPRIVTNSHMRVPEAMGKELLGDLCGLKVLQADSGMTVLRRLINRQGLRNAIATPSTFNPVASWQPEVFQRVLEGELSALDDETVCVHVFSKVREVLPKDWSFAALDGARCLQNPSLLGLAGTEDEAHGP